MTANTEAPISRLLREAVPLNIPFVAHYVQLAEAFSSSTDLVTELEMNSWTRCVKPSHKLIDPQGKLRDIHVRSCKPNHGGTTILHSRSTLSHVRARPYHPISIQDW